MDAKIMQRRDINKLSDSEVADYIHALDILRQRSAANPDDESGYDFQAGLHNDPLIGPCEHKSDLFLPWHRAHLYYFEQLLQQSDPPRTANVTIPYWDWIHPEPAGKFPAAFSLPGLFVPGRNPNRDPPTLPPDTLEIVTGERDQGEFGGYPLDHPGGDAGRLEYGPHDFMHPFFIGGKMASPSTAAEDPIYFSFHCFIDLLWAEWQQRNGAPALTSPDHDLRGFLSQPKHQVGNFHSTTALGYEYEYTDKLKSAFAISLPAPASRKLLATETLQPLFKASVAAELRANMRVQFDFPPPPAAGAAAVVRLEQLKVPTTGSYMLRAYVHPKAVPFDPDDTEFAGHYYVGYVAMWRSHPAAAGHGAHEGHEHHHRTSITVRLDVAKALAGVTPEATSDQVLTLQYIPAPDPAGGPPPAPEVLEEVTLNDVLMEVYG
jgi:hypothetical protein